MPGRAGIVAKKSIAILNTAPTAAKEFRSLWLKTTKTRKKESTKIKLDFVFLQFRAFVVKLVA
jgi:hypothetical protein